MQSSFSQNDFAVLHSSLSQLSLTAFFLFPFFTTVCKKFCCHNKLNTQNIKNTFIAILKFKNIGINHSWTEMCCTRSSATAEKQRVGWLTDRAIH